MSSYSALEWPLMWLDWVGLFLWVVWESFVSPFSALTCLTASNFGLSYTPQNLISLQRSSQSHIENELSAYSSQKHPCYRRLYRLFKGSWMSQQSLSAMRNTDHPFPQTSQLRKLLCVPLYNTINTAVSFNVSIKAVIHVNQLHQNFVHWHQY